MIVKPALTFLKTNADAALIVTTSGILSAMTGNPNFPNPSPALPVLASARDAFATALADAADGGKTLTSNKNNKRAALATLLRELAAYLQVTCKGNLAMLLGSGFPIQKPQRQPIGTLPAPKHISLTNGQLSGQLDASMSPVAGAATYNWRVTTAAAPETVVMSWQTTAASNTFSGLTPGEVYRVQANAVGAAGPSNWSMPVAQRVL